MNSRWILRLVGKALTYEGVLMLPALAVALLCRGGDALAFCLSIALLLAVGLPLSRLTPAKRPLQAREGFAAVAVIWVLLSVAGAMPFVFSGAIPNVLDAVFESTSGFTTTGSTILTDIERLPRGVLFWRSFTHWLGGMGVLVFALALMPAGGGGAVFLLRAESPGPAPGKLLPRLAETAKLLYAIYFVLTAALTVALMLAGMSLYDALVHAFSTAGTGGFTHNSLSVGTYQSPAIEWILTAFMLLFGINFAVYYHIAARRVRRALKNEELWLYGALVLGTAALVFLQIRPLYGTGTSVRHALFQVSSIVTTTGFSAVDYSLWPQLSCCLLLCLMVIGSCAGSTGGGLKVARVLLMAKALRRAVSRLIHPRLVRTVRLEGKAVEDDMLSGVLVFGVAYVGLAVLGALILSLDNFDLLTTLTASLAGISNVGVGLGAVGPMGSYAAFSPLSKLTLTLLMILGRLEIFPVLMLGAGILWRKA